MICSVLALQVEGGTRLNYCFVPDVLAFRPHAGRRSRSGPALHKHVQERVRANVLVRFMCLVAFA